tara:strand:+ start:94 stop:663 length:570 start_codon:yes stop_codon:yes gene_type:complete
MHEAQKIFMLGIKDRFPEYFKNKKVLDVGSYDINGNNQYLLENCEYIGIDVLEGPSVTYVSKAHEYNAPSNSFDTIISTECFEHDMYYPKTLKNIIRLLKPNGLFVFTCASTGRREHGTLNSTREHSAHSMIDANGDKEWIEWQNYYKNLTSKDIENCIDISIFKDYEFEYNPNAFDLYFWGITKQEEV